MCTRNSYEYLRLREDVLRKTDGKCMNCGSTENIEIHHIIPLAFGGTNKIDNLIPLCCDCHVAMHNGFNLNDNVDHGKKGRKSYKTDEEAYKIFDDYFVGNIGVKELKELMGFSKTYKVGDSPQFKRYVKEKGIVRYRNNIDTILCRHDKLYPGVHVGFVLFENGIKEHMIYQKDKMVKPEEPVKKKPMTVEDLYEAYLTGAMGFAEADYRISKIRKFTQDDFRNTLSFEHYLMNHEIAEYQNNVDMIIRVRGDVKVGDEVGYILYTYGRKELMIHY